MSADERVEEEAEWWEPEPLCTMHYQVTLDDGRQLAIFRNMKTVGVLNGGITLTLRFQSRDERL